MLGSEHICWNLCNLCSDICSAGSERKRQAPDLLGLFNRISERLKGLMEYVGKELLISMQGASIYKECLGFNRYLLWGLLSLLRTSRKESNAGGMTSVLNFSLSFKVLLRSGPCWRLHIFLKISLDFDTSHYPLLCYLTDWNECYFKSKSNQLLPTSLCGKEGDRNPILELKTCVRTYNWRYLQEWLMQNQNASKRHKPYCAIFIFLFLMSRANASTIAVTIPCVFVLRTLQTSFWLNSYPLTCQR